MQETAAGLYCPAGDFYIDPWRPVFRAVITHAHSDHARRGSQWYLTTRDGLRVLQTRMGPEAWIESVDYGESLLLNGVRLSLHPAGHVLGSAQVRLEHQGEVCVVSGDFKLDPDPTCRQFEPVRCHTLVTECTFGLPIYRWPDQVAVYNELNAWWRECSDNGLAAIVYAYSLGKAQRLLAAVDSSIGPILCHSAVERVNRDYRDSGVSLPLTEVCREPDRRHAWSGSLVIAPPSVAGSGWLKKTGPASFAMASGWMLIRGDRRRQSLDRGFVLSDHADWPGLLQAIRAAEAQQVLVTHGYTDAMVRWLSEHGYDRRPLRTEFRGESEEESEP